MDAELMRALKPKITLPTAIRMHGQYATGIAVTTATLGTLWWTSFWRTWVDVMFPEGKR